MSEKTLTLSQCKEYVKNIKDLEVSCYQQKRLLQELKRQPSATKQRILELEHRLQTEKAPTKPLSPTTSLVFTLIFGIIFSFIGAIVGVVIAIIYRIILAVFSSSIHMFSSPWLPYILWGAIIGYIIVFILYLYWERDTKKNAIAEITAYPREVELFQEKQENMRNLIEVKKKQLSMEIPNKIAESEEIYQNTCELLKKYYNMGFIYPKYRGLVPICTIYEYLESGRCFSLLGHEGAYNLYENELRMNAIIGKLDEVIDRLDDISASQRLLAREIRQCNEQLSRISGTLDNIENNTALTQYYSKVTASNTTFMSWLAAYSYDEQKRNS